MAHDPTALSAEIIEFVTERHLATLTTMRADGITDRSQDAADIRNASASRRDPNPGSRGDRRQEWCQFTRDGPVDVRYDRRVKVLSHPHHPGQRRLAPEFAYLIQ